MSARPSSPYRYRLSGLSVASEFALPMRLADDPAKAAPPDVTIHLGEVAESLATPAHRGANWTADDRSFLLNLPQIGRFLAEDGRKITVCPAPETPLDDILVFVTGTAFAAILYQRGAMLLHGSAVVREGRAFVFCGASGAGKSTLAGALVRDGATLLADDVCAIEQPPHGGPLVHADGRALRLYPDSIATIGLGDGVGARVRRRIEKFHVRVGDASDAPVAAPLAAIYMLAHANAAAPAGITPFPLLDAAQALLHQTYRRRLALAYSDRAQPARRAAALLGHVPVFRLHRAFEFGRLDEGVAMLNAHWAGLR
ncbi:phosphoenolpyruvate carboxykinase (ATP) [Sphingomonas hengshuiensis]|uniref:hypothetical protein n=1 Tax=Sphingomonas hengshuiensis TaxID=1609977 RepID=UPI000A50DF51|nr:hypothetical protein [Sphingomonas hengshuiensis]